MNLAKRVGSLFLVFAIFLSLASPIHAQSFTFGAAGDYGTGSAYNAVLSTIKTVNPDFQLALGDLSYDTKEQDWCNTMANVRLAIVAGNHDVGDSSIGGNINNYIQYCPKLNVQMTGTYGKQYYFDYPPTQPIARFIMISPGLSGVAFSGFNSNYSTGSPGYTFVSSAIDEARASGIKWVVVGMHKNYISVMEKSNELGSDLIPMLINKKVDLILQGHEHGYERTHQLKCARVNTFDSTCIADSDNTYVKGMGSIIQVLGTGGKGLRGLNTGDSEYRYFASLNNTNRGIGKFVVSPTSIDYQFVKSDGPTFNDGFVLAESGTAVSPQPSPSVAPSPSIVPTPSPSPRLSPLPTPLPSPTTNVSPSVMPTSSPTPSNCPTLPTTTGTVSYNITTDNAVYRTWLRMMSNGAADSVWLQVDGQCGLLIGDTNTLAAGQWNWVGTNGSSKTPIFLSLSAGSHTLKLIGRENGVKLDKFILSKDPNCVPTDLGLNCTQVPVSSPTLKPSPSVMVSPTPLPSPSIVSSPISSPPASATPLPSPSLVASPVTSSSPIPSATPVAPTPGAKMSLSPVDDAGVRESSPNKNYGTSTSLDVDGGSQRKAYLRFDLNGIDTTKLKSATLYLNVTESSSNGQTVRAGRLVDWSEKTITYSNRPLSSDLPTVATFNNKHTGDKVSIDVLSSLKSLNYRYLSVTVEQGGGNGISFSSKEGGKSPRLELSY